MSKTYTPLGEEALPTKNREKRWGKGVDEREKGVGSPKRGGKELFVMHISSLALGLDPKHHSSILAIPMAWGLASLSL